MTTGDQSSCRVVCRPGSYFDSAAPIPESALRGGPRRLAGASLLFVLGPSSRAAATSRGSELQIPGLAAALTLLARDQGVVQVAFQMLDSPMLDDRQTTASSQLDNLYVWTREDNAFGWSSYLGPRYGTDDGPAYAAAARATNLADLPPTFICVGGADGFPDEAIEYARRLLEAGVACELHVYPGVPHGFATNPASTFVRNALQDREEWLRRRLGPPGRPRLGSRPRLGAMTTDRVPGW